MSWNRKRVAVLLALILAASHSGNIAHAVKSKPHAMKSQSPTLEKARVLMENGEYENASKLVSEIIKDRKQHGKKFADCYELLALCDYYGGNSGGAVSNAEEAGRLDPKDANVITTYAMVRLRKKVPEALKLAQTAISIDKKNARPHAVAALCFKQLEQPDGGEMTKAVELDPKNFDVNILAAEYYTQRYELENALKAYDRLVASHPNSSLAYLRRAMFKRNKYARASALSDFKKALELNPKDMLSRSFYARLLLSDKNYKEAAEQLTLYLRDYKYPAPNMYARRGECNLHLGKNEESINDYTVAIKELSPSGKDDEFSADILKQKQEAYKSQDYSTFWFQRAQAFEAAGQYERSLKDTESMLKVLPKDTSALFLRHKLFMKTGKYKQALLSVNKLIVSDSDVARWYTQRAEVYEKMGRTQDAAKDLKRARQLRVSGKLDEE